ncbi:MAG: AAA family ATPase [Gemmatimonadetes bacterium]|nr:AAA family ATPase [Gemmatimonadota bacterium]
MIGLVSSLSPTDLAQVERFLDVLPIAIARLSLETRLPRSAPPAIIAEELLGKGHLVYSNPAFDQLQGATAGALLGRRLGQLVTGGVLARSESAERFVRDGFRLDQAEVRVANPGAPRYLRATVIGVVEADLVTGIWLAVNDVSAERDLARRVEVQERETGEIVGSSPGIRRVLDKIGQVAATDTTVLITGETGTGKELIARAIHQRSLRATRPLVAVNCGAFASSLVESELFGHEKGAFTGAVARKVGRFELADGGTLFLDEIGDLPLDLQVKLLRVLQEGEFIRVGGTETIKVDVRVIAATHRDLPAAVAAGVFRQDLYYRLNVFPIRNPPLRERREDIPILVSHFTAEYANRLGKRIEAIPPRVLEALSAHSWPGNIRELANLIERSVIITAGTSLQLGEWATGQYNPVAPPVALAGSKTLEDLERDHIARTLERTGWKVSGPGGAAEVLNLKPTTLEARMKKLGIARPR